MLFFLFIWVVNLLTLGNGKRFYLLDNETCFHKNSKAGHGLIKSFILYFRIIFRSSLSFVKFSIGRCKMNSEKEINVFFNDSKSSV